MHTGWEWVDQGTDEMHVYRRRHNPRYELHGYRLNRCGWLWHVMLNGELAGRKEHTNLDDAIAEAERLTERQQRREGASKLSPHAPVKAVATRRKALRVR